MNVLRSKRTGRHWTATVARSIILRPPLFQTTFLWRGFVAWSLDLLGIFSGGSWSSSMLYRTPASGAHPPARQCHALDLAAVAEPKLHRPRRACRRVNRKKFTIYPIHFRHVRDVSQYDMHAQDTFKRRAGGLQHVPHIG